jgi:hypothetical protein
MCICMNTNVLVAQRFSGPSPNITKFLLYAHERNKPSVLCDETSPYFQIEAIKDTVIQVTCATLGVCAQGLSNRPIDSHGVLRRCA